MDQEITCPIWKLPADAKGKTGDFETIYSPRAGGHYEISGSAEACDAQLRLSRERLSTWILSENLAGNLPRLTTSVLEDIAKSNLPSATETFELFLRTIGHIVPRYGQEFALVYDSDPFDEDLGLLLAAVGYDPDAEGDQTPEMALSPFFEHAKGRRLIKGDMWSYALTMDGYYAIEEMGVVLGNSTQIFVAMWFGDDELRKFYEVAIAPAIELAGYKSVRIDDQEHNEKICDQILAEIRKSKAVIADLTCGLANPLGWGKTEKVGAPRGGVFYEAGFAQGLGLPIIWTVKGSIADTENVTHFDVRQFNQIRWDHDFEEARDRIRNRIESTLGCGDA